MKTNVSTGTIVRTVILVVALVNQVLTATGKNPLPFSEETLYELLTLISTVAVSLWTWWKNNSFTKPAIEADNYLNSLKKGETENE